MQAILDLSAPHRTSPTSPTAHLPHLRYNKAVCYKTKCNHTHTRKRLKDPVCWKTNHTHNNSLHLPPHLRGASPTNPHVKTEHLPDGLNTVR